MSKIGLMINTAKYMTLRQWKYRFYYTVRNKLVKRRIQDGDSIKSIQKLSLNYKNDLKREEAVNIANNILNNTFTTISDITLSFNNEIDWNLENETYRLVCFRLNSFRYLLDLSDAYKVTGSEEYLEKGFQLIDNWWNSNSCVIAGDKWNPYVIAERVMNWIGFCSEYCDLTSRDCLKYANWIYQQSLELMKSIEYQLGANHLLSEGKALLIAGAFLKNKELYVYGKKILKDEYYIQFLPDGGHYERSVSYHIESLQQYFESIAAMVDLQDEEVEKFIQMITPAYQYLYGMVGVNGDIPLFNDSAKDYPFENAVDFLSSGGLLFEEAPPDSICGEYYRRWDFFKHPRGTIDWIAKDFYPETGYLHHKFQVGNERYSLFFDAGDGGPDSNMGHAHADALSILLANSKKELLVDSGVYTYKPGSERDNCRATKAHNTVEVDGRNSAEVWAAFRVARRGHTRVINYVNNSDNILICAVHDGYRKCLKSPVTHERTLLIGDCCIEIQDRLEGKIQHSAISRFHINGTCTIEMVGDKECIIDGKIKIISSCPMKLAECTIADKFGIIKPAKCLEIPFIIPNQNILYTKIFF